MPKKPKARQPLYKSKPPPPPADAATLPSAFSKLPLPAKRGEGRGEGLFPDPSSALRTPHSPDDLHATPIAPNHFTLRDDGSILVNPPAPEIAEIKTPTPRLIYQSETPFVRLYHGNCLELLDAIHAKYGDAGRFDCIFADPPYFLSNGGITCHAGKMVKVDKGDWDKSRGPELNHEFNLEWLRRCQRVLKPNGTIWVSGTQHVIFSIGYAMQQLGYKILNDITWEKPNPPPNLSCRYFTHSTETVIWAAKNEKSKHHFNYDLMRKTNGGKQMKTVWTMTAPGGGEKEHGKHPTQKPLALVERCLLAATNEGDLVLDPFLGGGTTAVAATRIKRGCVGTEMDETHIALAVRRTDHETVLLWLRQFRVEMTVAIEGRAGSPPPAAEWYETDLFHHERRARTDAPHLNPQNDLDPDARNMDRINRMKDGEPKAECIYHETKFVFLSCAAVSAASVIHTTVETSLQEAWAKTPHGKKRETTHIVRCQTEILRVKSS